MLPTLRCVAGKMLPTNCGPELHKGNAEMIEDMEKKRGI